MKSLLIVALLALSGCATPLTEYEREDRIAKDTEVWRVCQQVYAHLGKPTYHIDHSHDRMIPKNRGREIENMRSDIRTNNCRMIWRRVMRGNR